jgi:hypothetical protein
MSEGTQVDIEGGTQSAAKGTASDPAVLAAGASVLLALYTYYVKGDKQQGIFIGHWAPTILAVASYLRQQDIDEKVA